MNSSWKAFRALSAASWMGMSLWRMYSAREQDQPPSVLLVGTFYEKQQDTQAGRVAQVRQGRRGPSHTHPTFPWRMCSASRNNKISLHSSHSPSPKHTSHEPTSFERRCVLSSPSPPPSSISPRRGTRQHALIQLFHLDDERNHPKPSDSLKAERSVPIIKWAGIKLHSHRATELIQTEGTRANRE